MDPERYEKGRRELELELLQKKIKLQQRIKNLEEEEIPILYKKLEQTVLESDGIAGLDPRSVPNWSTDKEYFFRDYSLDFGFNLKEGMLPYSYIWRAKFTPEEEREMNIILLFNSTLWGIIDTVLQVITARVVVFVIICLILDFIIDPQKSYFYMWVKHFLRRRRIRIDTYDPTTLRGQGRLMFEEWEKEMDSISWTDWIKIVWNDIPQMKKDLLELKDDLLRLWRGPD